MARRDTRRPGGSRWLSPADRVVQALMLGVPLALVVTFIALPAVLSMVFSATEWTGVGQLRFEACDPTANRLLRNGCFTGMRNYEQAFTNYPSFWPALQHNVLWLLVFILIGTPLGMLFAVILNSQIKGSRFYQSMLFIPVTLSLALVGIIWEFMYSQNFGFINMALGRASDASAINWLGNSRINIWAVMLEGVWRQAGYIMVLYLAGLKAVDPSLLEAARVDGASPWQTFWRVTFPVMRPINIVVLVVTTIESLRAFDLVYIINKGTNGLELLSVLVTQNIVGETQRIGFGSALGTILLLISIVPIAIFLKQTFSRESR